MRYPSGPDLCRGWASLLSNEGRTAASVSFVGPSLFSCATRVGLLVENETGRAALLSRHTYSVTTARHLRWARNALREAAAPVFTVRLLEGGHDVNLAAYQLALTELLERCRRARRYKEGCQEAVRRLALEVQAYSDFFGLGIKVNISEPENREEESCPSWAS